MGSSLLAPSTLQGAAQRDAPSLATRALSSRSPTAVQPSSTVLGCTRRAARPRSKVEGAPGFLPAGHRAALSGRGGSSALTHVPRDPGSPSVPVSSEQGERTFLPDGGVGLADRSARRVAAAPPVTAAPLLACSSATSRPRHPDTHTAGAPLALQCHRHTQGTGPEGSAPRQAAPQGER